MSFEETEFSNRPLISNEALPLAIQAKNLTKIYHSKLQGTLSCFNKNANKTSTSAKVLNELNINVAKGAIYGLLGPSGCGKTTLLKCLIGILEVQSGEILIEKGLQDPNACFRIDLRRMGFMPQECCIYDELTIAETFFYFGKLHSMTNAQIKERTKFLIDLLELPSQNRTTNTLSGGQQRRVSLASTIIHQPSLLMLDEPTVGTDPLLRKKIWDYLIHLSNDKKITILITTHYIEEARNAYRVGFMNAGKIIEEDRPDRLMQKYNSNVLESVFYEICSKRKKQSIESDSEYCEKQQPYVKNNTSRTRPSCLKRAKQQFCISLARLSALLYKDGKKCLRNKNLLIVQLFVPILQICLFCLCIGQTLRNIPVGYVNLDKSVVNIGQMIIDKMDNESIAKTKFKNVSYGLEELRKGNIWALIQIDEHFSEEIINLRQDDKLNIPDYFQNIMHVYSDNTNYQITTTIRNALITAIIDILDYEIKIMRLMNDPMWDNFSPSDQDDYGEEEAEQNDNDDKNNDNHTTKSGLVTKVPLKASTVGQIKRWLYPVNFETPIYGSEKPVFTHFMAPGVAVSVVFFLSVAATASCFVLETRLGLTERSYIAGVKIFEMLISLVAIYCIILLLQIAIVMFLLFYIFNLPLNGSMILLVGLLFSNGFAGLCYGIMISVLCNTEEAVIQVTLATFYPLLLMSGIIWPIEGQPEWLKNMSSLLPLTYATDAFRAILERGWGLTWKQVLYGFATTYTWTLIFCVVIVLLFSLKSVNKGKSSK